MNETTEKTPFVNSENQSLLLVKGNIQDKIEKKTYRKKLSHAIQSVITKHGSCVLRCVGDAAISNAVWAISISSNDYASRGESLTSSSTMQTVNFDSIGEKTAIVFTLNVKKG